MPNKYGSKNKQEVLLGWFTDYVKSVERELSHREDYWEFEIESNRIQCAIEELIEDSNAEITPNKNTAWDALMSELKAPKND